MKMNRRELLLAGGLSLVGNALGSGQVASPTPAQRAAPRPEAGLLRALASQGNRMPISMDGSPSGAGWDWLVKEASAARFTLIGEEHGVAETARLASALFGALRASGYTKVAIELSPPIAEDIEAAARRNGYAGIVDLLKDPGIFTFSNMKEEAQFLADVIRASRPGERMLWGLDREIFSDRYLIRRLEAQAPKGARDAVARLKTASLRRRDLERRPRIDRSGMIRDLPRPAVPWLNPVDEQDAS